MENQEINLEKTPTIQNSLLTLAEASENLKVHRNTILQWYKNNKIEVVIIRKRKYIPCYEIERLKPPIGTKLCTLCVSPVDENNFIINTNDCKTCSASYRRKYYKNNTIRVLNNIKKWTDKNKDEIKKYNKKWREENKDRIKIVQHNGYVKNKDKVKEKTRIRKRLNRVRLNLLSILNKYKITEKQYEHMQKISDNKCMICGKIRKLSVDHNHDTGDVRGLLCHKCNIGIGFLEDNIDILRKAIIYLEKSEDFRKY